MPVVTSNIRMQDMAASERPREKLAAQGAEKLENAELIAILLRTGIQGISPREAGRALIARFKTLDQLARASLLEIQQASKGIGPDKAVTLKSAFVLAQRMASELREDSPLLDSPERIADYLREDTRLLTVEEFRVVLLNTRRRLIRVETISQGILDTILVHPREVFRTAILGNAAAIIVVHNHPSGDPTPSEADIKVTRDLIRAGQLLKIEVLDHVILGRRTEQRPRDYASLRELGYFYS